MALETETEERRGSLAGPTGTSNCVSRRRHSVQHTDTVSLYVYVTSLFIVVVEQCYARVNEDILFTMPVVS